MKSRLFAALVFATLATASFAADITGKWTAEVPGRNGQTRTSTFDFKVDGEKLTGTTSGMGGDVPLVDGSVKGDDIAFNVEMNFNGNTMKMMYKGKVTGDVIKMTRTREGAEGPAQEFEAKRAK
jgi:opacity protein-like surface antigen